MKASGTFRVHAISEDYLGRHVPPADADASWQESWGLAWHDPQTRTGGWNHIGLQRERGFADVWSWLAVDGVIVGRYNCLREPLPERDLPDFALGGMDVRNQDLRNLTITASYPGARAELRYTAYTDPFGWDIRPDKIDMGTSHYESQGRVRGRVVVEDRQIAVNGAAWQDHSWGPRDWSQSLAHRWIMANCGSELFLSAWQVVTTKGNVLAGFVYDGDTFHAIDRIMFGASLYDNGHQPHRCDARFWTELGRGYHITGHSEVSAAVAHDAGFWMDDGLAEFAIGGRLGAGILEVRERAALPDSLTPFTNDVPARR
jgi:hypothetical protein